MYLVDIKYYLGSKISTNKEVEEKYNLNNGFIFDKTGIKERRIFSDTENPIDLSAGLINQILEENNIDAKEIKVIYGSSNPYSTTRIPSETHQVAIRCGFKNVGIHHVNYGCGGYLAGLQDIYNYLKVEEDSYILFLLSDYPSKMVKSYNTEALFSDSVCVSLWTNSSKYISSPKVEGVFYSNLLSSPESLTVRDGYWEMNGGEVSKFVLEVPALVQEKLRIIFSGYVVIPHQANPNLIYTIEKKYNIKMYKDDGIEFGNTTVCALFIAIANNLKKDKTKDYLCMAFGDTESYGAFIIRNKNV